MIRVAAPVARAAATVDHEAVIVPRLCRSASRAGRMEWAAISLSARKPRVMAKARLFGSRMTPLRASDDSSQAPPQDRSHRHAAAASRRRCRTPGPTPCTSLPRHLQTASRSGSCTDDNTRRVVLAPDTRVSISLHSYSEAAAALCVEESWLRRHIKKLPHSKLGGREVPCWLGRMEASEFSSSQPSGAPLYVSPVPPWSPIGGSRQSRRQVSLNVLSSA